MVDYSPVFEAEVEEYVVEFGVHSDNFVVVDIVNCLEIDSELESIDTLYLAFVEEHLTEIGQFVVGGFVLQQVENIDSQELGKRRSQWHIELKVVEFHIVFEVEVVSKAFVGSCTQQ